MRKVTAFIASFAAVLIAGTAIAQMSGTPTHQETPAAAETVLSEPNTVETPRTTDSREKSEQTSDQPSGDSKEVFEEPPEKTVSEHTPDAEKREEPITVPLEVVEEPPPDTDAPEIVVISPVNGQVFETKTVRFSGETEPGAAVFSGDYRADVDETGHWSIVLVLRPGGNLASFTAVDAAGNVGKTSLEVVWRSESAGEQEWRFTAHQQYGSCREEIPYDVFWGTGKPGSWILVSSEFGAADAHISENGEWEVKVTFEKAPVDKTFQVVVKDAFGDLARFDFTRTG